MNALNKQLAALVFVLIANGAAQAANGSNSTPPVFKQLATIKVKCTVGVDCKADKATLAHSHAGLDGTSVKPGKKFKLNKKILKRYARFVDIVWDLFDEYQRPDLHVIHAWEHPLSFDSIEEIPGCDDINLFKCIRIKNFPLALGVRLLENNNKSITPHAYLYIPFRVGDVVADKGDYFSLGVLHIPDDIRDCTYPETGLGKRHCLVLYRISEVWGGKKVTPDQMKAIIESQYRWYLDHFFDDFFFDRTKLDPAVAKSPRGALSASVATLASGQGAKKTEIQLGIFLEILFKIFMHNDIIHGDLQ